MPGGGQWVVALVVVSALAVMAGCGGSVEAASDAAIAESDGSDGGDVIAASSPDATLGAGDSASADVAADGHDAASDATDDGADANAAGVDASEAGLDANEAGVDATEPVVDANEAGVDATEPAVDANEVGVDASEAAVDTGSDGASDASSTPDTGLDAPQDAGAEAVEGATDASFEAEAAAREAGGAGAPCVTDVDCLLPTHCGYDVRGGCAAQGHCIWPPTSCAVGGIGPNCACDGTYVYLDCSGAEELPTGYSPKPVLPFEDPDSGICTIGTRWCANGAVQSCDSTCHAATVVQCEYGCYAASCMTCAVGSTQCAEGGTQTCRDGFNWSDVLCDGSTCDGGAVPCVMADVDAGD
jgi:hypothetical protein